MAHHHTHHHTHHKKHRGLILTKEQKKLFLKVLAVLIAAASIIVGWFLARRWEQSQKIDLLSQEEEGELFYQNSWYARRSDIETILLFGVDKYERQLQEGFFTNDQQSDFLVLLIIDRTNDTCKALPLNRDTMAEITRLDLTGGAVDSFTGQLALAHTYGSGEKDSGRNTTRAVSTLLYGVKIDHYVGITMDAVGILTDAVDGVPVKVEQDFSDVLASPADLPMGQTVTLTGDLALTFVRARSGVGEQTNIERMGRQQQFMQSFYTRWKEKAAEDELFLANTLLDLSPYMTTDCSAETLSRLNDILTDCSFTLLDAPEGESVVGQEFMEFYVDEDALKKTVVENFYRKLDD